MVAKIGDHWQENLAQLNKFKHSFILLATLPEANAEIWWFTKPLFFCIFYFKNFPNSEILGKKRKEKKRKTFIPNIKMCDINL